jgi:polyisoprenoid-binding protein YceI
MKRSLLGWLVVSILAIGGAALAYVFWFAGGSGEPSTELTTPTIAAGDTATTPSGSDVAGTVYVIDQTESSARFEIDEVLRGEPKTVIGATDQVAGQVVVDVTDLSTARFSEILINARTFNTDAEQRNRAIRGPVILGSGSDEFEFISFVPTAVDGLTGAAAEPGASYEFTILGDLTIKGTTAPISFAVIVEMVDEGTIQGTASAQVLRSDFGIGIPSVPFVADVTDEVTLSLDFVAVAG